jgi:hypothetical protein
MKIISLLLYFVLLQTATKAQQNNNMPPVKTSGNTLELTHPSAIQQAPLKTSDNGIPRTLEINTVPVKETADKPVKSAAVNIVTPPTASSVSLKETTDKAVQQKVKPAVVQ